VGEVRDRTVREPEPRPFVAPLFTLAATVLIELSRSARALVVGFRHRSHLLNLKSIGLEALNMPDTAPNDQKSVDGLSAVSKVRSISLPSSVLLPPIRSGGPSEDRAERNIRPTASCLYWVKISTIVENRRHYSFESSTSLITTAWLCSSSFAL